MNYASRRMLPVFAGALVSSLLLVSPALAGTPSTVTVRVVGLTGTTLLPQTQVTTTDTPIDPDGNPSDVCSGTSAGGALYDATQGNWVVKYDDGLGYEIDGIQGLNFPSFSPTVTPDAYWSFWLNGAPATNGACDQELNQGDDVVFFAQCDEIGTDCPTSATAPEHFLTEVAPSSSSVQVGTPVAVTVGSLNTGTGTAESSLPSGVTVTAGSLSTIPNAQGMATLTFSSVGIYTIQAQAPNSVPSDPQTICVHNGNDGNCGTTLSSGSGSSTFPMPTKTSSQSSVADVAKIAGVKNGHVYSRHSAPRLLTGVVEVPSGGTLRSGADQPATSLSRSLLRLQWLEGELRKNQEVWFDGFLLGRRKRVLQLSLTGASSQGKLYLRHRGNQQHRSGDEARERNQPRCFPGQVEGLQ